MLRYLVALAVATAIIGGGVLFVRSTFGEIEGDFEQFRQQLKDQKTAGTLPKQWENTDLDKLKYTDFGMLVSTSMQIRLDIAAWLTGFWYVFVPLVILVCIGAAHLAGRVFGKV